MRRLASLLAVAVPAAIVAQTYRRVVAAQARQRETQALDEADAIVVLGGECYPHGPCLEVCDRLDHAVALWQQGLAPRVLASGGIIGDIDEVDIMQKYLLDAGLPAEAVGEARPGDNTRLTLSALDRQRRYIAVSSSYHAHRLATEAARQGLDVQVSCSPDGIDLQKPRNMRVHRYSEVAGSILYATPSPVAGPVRRAIGRLRHDVPERFRR